MNQWRLVLNNLRFFWKTNLAVWLGLIAGTAVITGALIVGDSVRESLTQMTYDRLGQIDYLLQSPRFFREELADDLKKNFSAANPERKIAPMLSLNVGLVAERESEQLRANQVQFYGVDSRAWDLLDHAEVDPPGNQEILLNSRVAKELKVQQGDEVSVWIELPSSIPRDSLLGKREETTIEMICNVRQVLPESLNAGRLGFQPNQQSPPVAFVSLPYLQEYIGLHEIQATAGNPDSQPGRVNTLVLSTTNQFGKEPVKQEQTLSELEEVLKNTLQLEDLNLVVRENEKQGYLSLESSQMFLEPTMEQAAEQAAETLKLKTSPVLVYLANEMHGVNTPEKFSMYSIVAGVDFSKEAPFGPLQFKEAPKSSELADDEIILNSWLAEDLQVKVGDEISLAYHVVGSYGELPEEKVIFKVAGICELAGTVAGDSGLTPTLKGITDADTFNDWDQPFPMEMERITDRDDEYWEKYRATPKAFLSLHSAQKLWNSRFGELTSYRVASRSQESLSEQQQEFETALLQNISPEKSGLMFRAVKSEGLAASRGTNDFSQLFLGFSFYIILAALVLVSLLFKLNLERRCTEIGLLSALGYTPARIRKIWLVEGGCLVLLGGGFGAVLAIAYGAVMMYGLATWWNQAVGTQHLQLYVKPLTLLTGAFVTGLLSLGGIWRALALLKKQTARELLSGQLDPAYAERKPLRAATILFAGSTGVSLLLLIAGLSGLLPGSEAFGGFSWQIVIFFVVGFGLLISSLSGFNLWLNRAPTGALTASGWRGLTQIATLNATQNRPRSLLTVTLMSLATFIIVAVASGHRDPAGEKPELNSGNGGFTLIAESSSPLLYDLQTAEGREKLFFNPEEQEKLTRFQAFSFRVQPGEEASCLNLYQTQLPTILGVPQDFIDRGGFRFADTPGENPWKHLTEKTENGSIPVIGDMNTLRYSLKKGLGSEIEVPDSTGTLHSMQVAGMLDGSLFQGVLLMSEENFRGLFPDRAGFQYFLMEVPADNMSVATTVLESELSEFGFDVEPVATRLTEFLAVQNTFLSTFQTLGGLGLLLGTFGLATVMLRNVLERRSELALLQAVGFTRFDLGAIVLIENGFLMTCGLLSGTLSALLAMSPYLLSSSAGFPWQSTLTTLVLIWLIGVLTAVFSIREAVRGSIVNSLRAL